MLAAGIVRDRRNCGQVWTTRLPTCPANNRARYPRRRRTWQRDLKKTTFRLGPSFKTDHFSVPAARVEMRQSVNSETRKDPLVQVLRGLFPALSSRMQGKRSRKRAAIADPHGPVTWAVVNGGRPNQSRSASRPSRMPAKKSSRHSDYGSHPHGARADKCIAEERDPGTNRRS